MVVEVHDAPMHDMDCSIRECAHLFHDRWSRGHLSLFFCIQILSNMLILFFNVF
jgi:hypothetical protein